MVKSLLVSTGLMFSAFSILASSANAGYACQQRVDQVTSVLRDRKFDCESMGRQEACDQICAVVQQQVSGVDPREVDQIRRDTERRTLDRVRQDINAEGTNRAGAVGATPEDCLNRARARAHASDYDTVAACNNQSQFFKNCAIAGERIIQPAILVTPSLGTGKVDDLVQHTNPADCKMRAESSAVANALDNCRRSTGANCVVSQPASPATFRERSQKRYGFFGPTDYYYVCESNAQARPDDYSKFQCVVEVFARNRF